MLGYQGFILVHDLHRLYGVFHAQVRSLPPQSQDMEFSTTALWCICSASVRRSFPISEPYLTVEAELLQSLAVSLLLLLFLLYVVSLILPLDVESLLLISWFIYLYRRHGIGTSLPRCETRNQIISDISMATTLAPVDGIPKSTQFTIAHPPDVRNKTWLLSTSSTVNIPKSSHRMWMVFQSILIIPNFGYSNSF